MKNIIAIHSGNINGNSIQTVNARDLHEYLENRDHFATWIKDRVKQYGFVESQDFVVIREVPNNSSGGRPSNEYHISLDMAKELSMVERNAKGKEARQYFIQCEKVAKQSPALDFGDPDQLRGLLGTYLDRTIIAEAKLIELQPAVEAYERISKADGSLCMRDAAKNLQLRPIDLNNFLSHNGWIYRQSQKGPWLGYQAKITTGLLEHKVFTVDRSDGTEKITTQCRITPKGLAKLAKLLPPTVSEAA